MIQEALRETALCGAHLESGAKMGPYAGWSMPLHYGSVLDEHRAVRHAAGMFDVSHMTRLILQGPDAALLLDRTLTRAAGNARPGRLRYCMICNASGGVIDDVINFRLPEDAPLGANTYLLVANASNREAVLGQLRLQGDGLAVEIDDQTERTAMIAVQGPEAVRHVSEMIGEACESLKPYQGLCLQWEGQELYVSRTGYTGEDGFELVTPGDLGAETWSKLLERGVQPCGLVARDLLRTEAAMPLYGQELSAEISPLEAGLGFAVDLSDDRSFVGRDALVQQSEQGGARSRIGLVLEGKRPARHGNAVLLDGAPIGEVTSGVFSPSLDRPVAMAYVDGLLGAGDLVQVDIRGHVSEATVVELPFYSRSRQ